jgi:hypothetical protein
MKIQIINKTIGTGKLTAHESKVLIDGEDITKKIVNIHVNLDAENDIPFVNLTFIPDEVEVEGEFNVSTKENKKL